MNKQTRAATTIMNCVDPKFQKELLVPQTDGTTGAAKMTSSQGTLFVKHHLMTFFGRDGSAIAAQADQIQELSDPIHLSLIFISSQNRLPRNTRFTTSLFATIQGNDQALAKELFQQVRDSQVTLETVFKKSSKKIINWTNVLVQNLRL